MKPWLPLLLCFVSALAQAEPRGASSPGVQAAASRPRPAAEATRKNAAALQLFLTDDENYLRLPAFATRTPSQPVRFIRVGVEWSF